MKSKAAVLVLVSLVMTFGATGGAASAIYGGEDADISEFPWMVYVLDEVGNSSCGGTLIDPSWVLTAAHCVYEKDAANEPDSPRLPADIRVVVGKDKTRPGQTITGFDPADFSLVSEIRFVMDSSGLVPAYESGPHSDNDIALLKLASPAYGVETVRLGYGEMPINTALTAAGWGKDVDDFLATGSPSQLQKLDDILVHSDQDCWGPRRSFPDTDSDADLVSAVQICTKAAADGGPRPGDSGGPLLLRSGGRWIQLGVASHLPRWCDPSKNPCGFWSWAPGLNNTTVDGDPNFTGWVSVAKFRGWITTTTAAAAAASEVSTALIIDSSGSMTSNDPGDRRLQAARAYVSASLPGDEVAVVDFDSSVRIASPAILVGPNRSALESAIGSIDSSGGTNLGAGIAAGCETLQLARGARRAAVFLTDGEGSYADQAACFRSRGWPVFTIGLGSGVDTALLDQIAGGTGGRYLALSSATNLVCEFQQIRSEVAGLGRSSCGSTASITQGETQRFLQSVPSYTAQFTFTTTWLGSDIQMTVTSPSGMQFDRNTSTPGVLVAHGATSESITVQDPEPGEWIVDLYGAEIPDGGEPFTLSTVALPVSDDQLDTDLDEIPDPTDNCPYVSNAAQLDQDANGDGDACDPNFGKSLAAQAVDDILTTQEDVTGTVAVLANDTGNGVLSIVAVTAPAHGSVKCTSQCEYTPNSNYNGTDLFTYTVTDSGGTSASATVSVEVVAVNDAPIAYDDALSVMAGSWPVKVGVLGNDADVDGDMLSLVSATADRGTVTIRDNMLEYTPSSSAGAAKVTYEVSDGHGGTAVADLTVDVLRTTPPGECKPDERLKCDEHGDGGAQAPVAASVSVGTAYVNPGQPVVVNAKGLCATQDVTLVLLRVGGILWDTASTTSVTVPVVNGEASARFLPDQIPGRSGAFIVYAKQYGCGIVVATSVVVKEQQAEPEPPAAPALGQTVEPTQVGTYSPVVPRRLLESRPDLSTSDGLSNDIGVRPAGSVTALQVTGRSGIPNDAPTAVLNVTVTEATGPGFLTVYPCGVERPLASHLNFTAGATVANAVIVKIGVGGKVCFYASRATHLVVDLNGFMAADSDVVAINPARLFDTRPGEGTVDGWFSGLGSRAEGSVTELAVAGRGGVPADASSVVLNVTVADPQGSGFVTVFPCGVERPGTSSVNFSAKQTVANMVVSKLSTDGRVCLFTSVHTDVLVDVEGYMAPGSQLTGLTPVRALDSRLALSVADRAGAEIGRRPAGSVAELLVIGRRGVPTDASAVVLNVTVTDPSSSGFITVYPCEAGRPNASSVNFVAGQTVSNAVIAKVGEGGGVCAYASAETDLVVDITGYVA